MAQAARLSRRMQKEVKLLLEDPPHGTSFPSLSDLSSLDALIEGPEGTVYAGGVFKIRVQIPERYPFQPPNVTFATPIYHPNIDTGGRICLDILNLPPKGGWQPSLNISTVLLSIRLLLSEPNPDDGLMCEASKEFKYDRQAFDRKARLMTEKYARAGLSCGSLDGPSMKPDPGLISLQVEDEERCRKLPKELRDDETASMKLGGMRQKLSLATSLKMVNKHDHITGPSPAVAFIKNSIAKTLVGGDQQGQEDDECVNGELRGMQKKLSSGISGELAKDFAGGEQNISFHKNPNDSSPSGSIDKSSAAKRGRLSLGVKEENEENLNPNMKLKSSLIDRNPNRRVNALESIREEVGESLPPDAIIVLDSEDSGDETEGSYVARKFLGQKRVGHLRSKTRRMK
ncbi:hypothetical protein MLD38_006856 [Melastoma candidum]|uniref:Uncharacterized protein n=1 Tax=Melastoma candidum TaxID=119954 RepID=A0ACB9RQJ7_9MYRT|nr:hypothetical protein MLD38_006856 [Melastoma candidum]